ncbi:Signal transduction histidine kinase [Flavobacterium gillisiae]|uniref:histidine kinase n=1 Tax=Flavobacterium gillisiae TaxID=150146 RepID=A0A1H3WHB4_9FLAO|nr:Signal transduction histidine kinase [Flavobacterium gillisiae]
MKRKLKQIFSRLLKIKTLKTSIFIPFFLFAFVFISVSLISIYVLHKKVIQKEVSFEYENIDTMLKDKIQSEALSLGLYIDRLSVNDSLVRAFKMNDRDLFQKVSKSYFKTTEFDLKPDLLNFISNDGIVRFRSHRPNEYGQKVTQQFIYKKALSTGTSFFHIGSGVYSNVSLKVIVPVRDTTQKVVGYIVVGKDFYKILEQIAKQTHMDFLFFSKVNPLNLKLNKNKLENFGSFKKGKDNLFLEWSTLPKNTKISKDIIETKIKSNAITSIKLNGIDYLSKSLPLIDFDEAEFGNVFVLHDNSIHFDDLKKSTVNLILISVLMIMVLSLIFNRILNKVSKNLFDKNQKLILELKRRIIADKKLIENNNELKQLTLIASHDLRSPLTNLEGLLDLLQNGDDGPEFKSLLIENASSSVELMKNTIDSLTTIIRQKESFLQESITEQSIESVFKNVVLQLKHLIDEKQIVIKSDFSECPTFLIAHIHLKSILLNIVSNAIKYASENPEITSFIEITTKIDSETRSIIIKDNGIGFDSNFQKEKLFKPFKRFHHEKAGSGIGLYLTKLIIENYNGKIQIKSEIGKGTTVKIDF